MKPLISLCIATLGITVCCTCYGDVSLADRHNAHTTQPPAIAAPTPTLAAVLEHYTELAHALFSDALSTAKILQEKVATLVANPTPANHQAAKAAWLVARIPYGQTEAFRFGNPNVDAWEGQVNAWPLDEGLIDYVKVDTYGYADGNAFATANVVAGTDTIDASLLRSLQEKGGAEANVASGYHAIEFLLWGQDLNATPQAAGTRPHTDFVDGVGCTNSNCGRRAHYLQVATDLLVADLQVMVDDWAAGKDNYRKAFLALEQQEALRRILFGMGSLSLGELAGERINVALLAHSQEDEHSCFSDNTHQDIAANAASIQNIFQGSYTRADGSTLSGASLAQWVASKDATVSAALSDKLANTAQAIQAVVDAAKAGEPFDVQVAADNEPGNRRVKAVVAALRSQTVDIEAIAKVLGISNLSPESSTALK